MQLLNLVVALALQATPRLELVDHLAEILAVIVAELLAHLPHPAGHALRVVLVEVAERAGIAQAVEPTLLGADEREARHEPGERAAPAVLAYGLDHLTRPQREHRNLLPARRTAILINRHSDEL